MSKPFFSIVLPTRNRSELARDAIQSVLNQSMSDFEIVVSDNDSPGSHDTYNMVEQFDDARIRYVRAYDLSMADNWEFGRCHATGEYIGFLGDKRVLRQSALEVIVNHIQSADAKIITWQVDTIDDLDEKQLFFKVARKPWQGNIQRFESKSIIEKFLNSHFSKTLFYLPRGLNSVTHCSIVEQIADKTGRLCIPLAPDYTMAFQQLAVADTLFHIPDPLTLSRIGIGNGTSFHYRADNNSNARNDFIQSGGGGDKFYNRVPLDIIHTQNMLYNDFLEIKDLIGGNLSSFDLPEVSYFVEVYRDLASATIYGADFSEDFAIWEETLEKQPRHIIKEVRKLVSPIRLRYALLTLGNRVSLLPVQRLYRLLKSRSNPRFKTVFDALQWEEAQYE